MSLRIFHYGNAADENYFLTGRFEGWTGRLKCSWWEWSGWYNLDIHQRLLGHYLLFQHFKKDHAQMNSGISVEHAYILQYRAMQGVKYCLSRITAFIWSIVTFGMAFPPVEIQGLNRILVNEGADILSEFLTEAEANFRLAMFNAAEKIQSPSFICKTSKGFSPAYLFQVNKQTNNQFNTYRNESLIEINHHHNVSFTKVNNQSIVKEGASGKEKDVLSKRQWMILFDLISATTSMFKKLDLSTHAKVEKAATLLHTLSGKDKTTFIKELNHYKNNGGFYKTDSLGELNQLIIALINMADIFRNNNQPDLAELIDKKIIELEAEKKRDYPNG